MARYTIRKSNENDGDGFTVYATAGGDTVGECVVRLEYEPAAYSFTPYEEEAFYAKIADLDITLTVQHIFVDDAYKGQGIGSELMRRAMRYMAATYAGVPCYLNASPMGNCMPLESLIGFYRKFGFRCLGRFTEHRNAFLYIGSKKITGIHRQRRG